jgi:16S rRNA (cytosine1402-N4)-methyltransferase
LVERREAGPLTRADEIAELIRRALPRARPGSIDPATRTFQALRIAVNDELGALERTLGFLPDVLRPGGRAAIISFHSLEDRLVKQAFRADPRYRPLTSKPLIASESEVHQNPRARSAKLRVAERVAT